MNDEELKKIMSNMDIPEPSQQATARAKLAAKQEFSAAQEEKKKISKGNAEQARFTDSSTQSRSYFMKHKYLYGGLATSCLLVVGSFGVYNSIGSQLDHTFSTVGSSLRAPEAMFTQGAQPQKAEQKMMVDSSEPLPAIMPPPPMEESDTYAADMASPAEAPPPPYIERAKAASQKRVAMPDGAAGYAPPQAEIMPLQAQKPGNIDVLAKTLDAQNPQYKDVGRDKFEDIKINPVKLVKDEAVSTFSVDVDTTSYSFMRRMLNEGSLPQKDAIRTEELINYFDYDYELPGSKAEPFKPNVAVYQTPWNEKTKLIHIGIKGYDIAPTEKPRSNLVFLLDVSGSMESPDKLPLLINSLKLLVNNLKPEDTISVVTYAGSEGVALEPTKVKDKQKILTSLDNLQAGGGTAGAAGIKLAYQLAEQNFDKNAVNRVILATDGDFNVGITNPEELKGFVERQRDKGIFLSVLGFGQGNYNDQMMQTLAQNGNGNASYIDSLNEARKVLVDEASSTLFTIAKDVKIQVEFNPKRVSEYRLIGYETRALNREDFNNDKVDAGDIGSGHAVTAIYEITEAGKSGLVDESRYEEKIAAPSNSSEYAFVKIRYKLPDTTESKLITKPVTDADNKVTSDVKFATAVAAFGQILQGGQHTGKFSYDDVIALAGANKGRDDFGYRTEFVNLVRNAKAANPM